MAEVRFTVRGAHRAFHPAERGTVHARVGLEGPDSQSVYNGVARSAESAVSSITELHHPEDGPITWWSSGSLRTWSNRPWNSDGLQLPLVHHAQVDFHAKFRDFGAISGWLARAMKIQGFAVDHIEWTLTEARAEQLTADSRVEAVRAAVEKAQAYADALGLGQVRCSELADAGMLGSGPTMASDQAMFARMAGGGPEVSFAPEDIEIRTEVDAVFWSPET